MAQVKALNALEPFLALTKSATSPRAAADLVVRATSAPNTYLFTELLEAPQIQALSTVAEFASFLKLLEIFSYGTYPSYTSAAADNNAFPALNDAQKLKLRQLSLLTLANENGSDRTSSPALAYGALVKRLGLASPRELEEVVISAIYAGLINAQLDPKNEQVLINSVSPLRDVAAPGDGAISGILSNLQAFAGRCDATLNFLEDQMSRLRADADKRAAEKAAWTARMDNLVKEEEKGGAALSDHGGNTQTSSMLTVGALSFSGGGGAAGRSGGRSAPSAGGRLKGLSSPSAAAANNGNNPLTHGSPSQRYGKRVASSSQPDGDDEAMDLDDEEELGEGGVKRASKRKL